jgi:outer membrane lipoprotein carrier protein
MHSLLLFLLALCLAPTAHASALERLKSFVAETKTAQASFEQTVRDKTGKVKQQASGTLALSRPGRFRWQYDKPFEQTIVGDGQKLWLYDVDLEQVTVRRLEGSLGSSPAALLAGSGDIERYFSVRDDGARDGLEWLTARPRQNDISFERVRMGFGKNGLEVMELADHFGQTTTLRFSAMKKNPPLDAARFRFTPPKGVDVIGE